MLIIIAGIDETRFPREFFALDCGKNSTVLPKADSKINIVKIDMNHPDLVAFENWQNDGLVFSDGMRNFSNFNRICDTDMDLRIFSLGSQNYLLGGIDGKLTIIGMELK